MQLEARYKTISQSNCPLVPALPVQPKPYLYSFHTEGDALDHFVDSAICNNPDAFCVEPHVLTYHDWAGGYAESGFLPSSESADWGRRLGTSIIPVDALVANLIQGRVARQRLPNSFYNAFRAAGLEGRSRRSNRSAASVSSQLVVPVADRGPESLWSKSTYSLPPTAAFQPLPSYGSCLFDQGFNVSVCSPVPRFDRSYLS